MKRLVGEFKFHHWPLWLMRLLDGGRTGLRLARPVNKYSLADRADSLSCQPLFIVSSGRAGTTLLRSMLVAGGQIAIPPESQVLRSAVRKFSSLQHLGWADLCRVIIGLFAGHSLFPLWQTNLSPVYQTTFDLPENERSLARVVDEVYKHYAAQHFTDAVMWGDQSPLNTFYWRWIYRPFPQARFVHLVRDGRDAIASLVERGLALQRATHRWIASIEECRALAKHLNREQFLEVRYEDLVSEPEHTLQQICGLLDLAYTPRMLEFWKFSTTIEHKYQSYHRNLARPVFTDSIGRWKTRLSSGQQEYILTRTAHLLAELGYTLE